MLDPISCNAVCFELNETTVGLSWVKTHLAVIVICTLTVSVREKVSVEFSC